MNDLQTMYLALLGKVWSIEDQLIVELPKMAEEAHTPDLKAAILKHLEETKIHRERIEKVSMKYKFDPKGDEGVAFETLLEETREEMEDVGTDEARDAFIIAAAQTVEHIEMAKYMTLIEWAKELDDEVGEDLLKKTLEEEESADETLRGIAKGGVFTVGVNEEAV